MEPIEVNSRQTFAKFVEALNQDLIDYPTKWENVKLTDFLDAVSRYSEDIQGYYDNTGQNVSADEPTWRVFADLLKGASLYE